jgi:hypothetical protein
MVAMDVRNGSSSGEVASRSALRRIVRRSRPHRKPRESAWVVAAVAVGAAAVEGSQSRTRTRRRNSHNNRDHRANRDRHVRRRLRVPIRRMAARRAPRAKVRNGGDVFAGGAVAAVGRRADRRQRRFYCGAARRVVGYRLSVSRCQVSAVHYSFDSFGFRE